jgi:hypothetical protein
MFVINVIPITTKLAYVTSIVWVVCILANVSLRISMPAAKMSTAIAMVERVSYFLCQ